MDDIKTEGENYLRARIYTQCLAKRRETYISIIKIVKLLKTPLEAHNLKGMQNLSVFGFKAQITVTIKGESFIKFFKGFLVIYCNLRYNQFSRWRSFSQCS